MQDPACHLFAFDSRSSCLWPPFAPVAAIGQFHRLPLRPRSPRLPSWISLRTSMSDRVTPVAPPPTALRSTSSSIRRSSTAAAVTTPSNPSPRTTTSSPPEPPTWVPAITPTAMSTPSSSTGRVAVSAALQFSSPPSTPRPSHWKAPSRSPPSFPKPPVSPSIQTPPRPSSAPSAIPTTFTSSASSDWGFAGTLPLQIPVSGIQGVSYRDGFVYISGTNGALYRLCLADRSMQFLMQSPVNGEFEGLDFHGSQLRWLVNRSDGAHILYSYEPAASATP